MPKYAFALLAVTFALLPVSLRACGGCGCDDTPVVIHFKDGLTPNGPVTGDPGQAVTVEGASGCGCNTAFGFRDYGPTHAPAPVDTKQIIKRPTS